jgi:hypothetical protein
MLVLPAATRIGVECGHRQSVQYRISTATASRPRDAWATLDSLLTQLADKLLVQDITEPSAVLGSLSDVKLQNFYDAVLEQFALALLIGAHENSKWSDGKLVIAGNRANIHLLQAAFYVLKLECQRRDLMIGCF